MNLNLKLSTISWAIVIGLLVSGLGYSGLLYLSGESVSVIQQEVSALQGQLGGVQQGAAQQSVASISANLEVLYGRTMSLFAITVLFILLAVAIMFWLLIYRMVKPIQAIERVMHRVEEGGDFSLRVGLDAEDELGEMARVFDGLLESLHDAIEDANAVVTAVAAGDFSKRINADYRGDLAVLKEGVNGSAASVQTTMTALEEVMEALAEGDFSQQMDEQVEEKFRLMVNEAMGSVQKVVKQIIRVVGHMASGDFSQRVELEVDGSLEVMKEAVNASMETLEHAIQETVDNAVRMGEGDLTQEISGNYHGQLDTMKRAINSTQKNLSHVVSQVRLTAQRVGTGSSEISRGNQDLSSRTAEQAASLEQTAASMEQMASTVKMNADNSMQANQLSADASRQAEAGAAIVRQAITAMAEINASSSQISEIIALIDGIAFQTNLLALNAAVEAARAGEQGSGFAVVAGEVRTLAQRSAEAAKEIKTLIEESGERIGHGSELVNRAGEALESIEHSIKRVNDVASEISAAAQEQTSGIDQVNLAVSELDSVNQQNAALVEEAAAASSTLSDQADGLTELVAFFKLSRTMEGHTSEMSGFTELFTRAKAAHIAWKEKIRAVVEGRLSADGSNILTCKECELGSWISREGVQRYGRLEEMSRLEQVHQQMHQTIEEILAYKRSGDQQQCEASYGKIEPLSKEVVSSLRALEKRMSQVDGAHASTARGGGASAASQHTSQHTSQHKGATTAQTVAPPSPAPQRPPAAASAVIQRAPAADDSEWDEF